MNFLTSLILPILAAAQIFVLVITGKNGEKYEIETENISTMEFVEITPTPLPTPNVTLTTNSGGAPLIKWDAVPNAYYYYYSLDGATEVSTYDTFLNVQNLAPGKHNIYVVAVPSDERLAESERGTLDFTIELSIAITQNSVGTDNAVIKLTPSSSTVAYLAAVLPSDVTTDADRISQVRTLAASNSSLRHTGAATVTFSNLTPGTSYQVVAFQEQNPTNVYKSIFNTTNNSYKPGDVAYVFPPGVSLDGGYVDVDKVGDVTKYGWKGNDEELCWVCSTAGMIQWWLNDYKSATGKDYPMKIALPATSQCYSTPVMDVLVQAFYHDAGDPTYPLQWFFSGMPNSVGSYTVNGHAAFDTDYVNVNGNFLGIPRADYSKYIPNAKKINSWGRYNTLTEAQLKVQASADFIQWLTNGPLYIEIKGGGHALTCWGVRYKVDTNGNPIIDKIYFAENDIISGNVKNGLNSSSIMWKVGDGPHMYSTGGENVEITGYLPMIGYSRAK